MRAVFALVLLAAPAAAQQDFSQGSEARSWNLGFEAPARFEAEVVDLLCTLTGDCPADCGAGRRQLGLLRAADGVLVYPNKNNQPAFTGAVQELLPFCGQKVEVDGLLIEDDYVGAANVYLLQRIRAAGSTDWITANAWTRDWEAAHPEAAGEGPWFRRAPAVETAIEADGYLGLGAEADAAFVADWFR